MIPIILFVLGLILLFTPRTPISLSRELKRPNSIYLGVGFLFLASVQEFFINKLSNNYWMVMIVPIVAIIFAVIFVTPKIPEIEGNQLKTNSSKITSAITWFILLSIFAVLLYLFFKSKALKFY